MCYSNMGYQIHPGIILRKNQCLEFSNIEAFGNMSHRIEYNNLTLEVFARKWNHSAAGLFGQKMGYVLQN